MLDMAVRYIGSGPYCYANSLAMVLGPAAPSPAVIEVLTGSPFGVALLGGTVPFFSPLGWDPGIGLDAAIELLGWTCVRTSAGSPVEAGELWRQAREGRPVLAGPMEFGLLRHHPESGIALGSDHYVVVLGAEHGLAVVPGTHPAGAADVVDGLMGGPGQGRKVGVGGDLRPREHLAPQL